MTVPDHDVIAERIVAEIHPKTVLVVGCADGGLVSALRDRGCDASGIEWSTGALAGVPAAVRPHCVVASALAPFGARYDLVVALGGLEGLAERDRRRALENICAATENVMFALGAGAVDAPARMGGPRSHWTELFAEQGFFLDLDFDARFVGPLGLRFRRVRKGEGEPSVSALKRLQDDADNLYRILEEKEDLIDALRATLTAHEATVGWRALVRLRKARERLIRRPLARQAYWTLRRTVQVLLDEGVRGVVQKTGHKLGLALRGKSFVVQPRDDVPQDFNAQYELWLERRRASAEDREAMRWGSAFADTPVISVLAVVSSDDEATLPTALDSMQQQLYPRWELCLAVAPGTPSRMRTLLEAAAASDPRIRLAEHRGPGPALGDALRAATGEFVSLVDMHDALAPEALSEVVGRLNADASPDIVYSDEDVLTPAGRHRDPFFKPDWSPDLLLSTNYIGRLGLVRRTLVEAVGGFRLGFEASAEYDLMLRAAERTDKIAHVPKVLYHRGQRVPSTRGIAARRSAAEADTHAIEDSLRRRGLEGHAEAMSSRFSSLRCYSVRYAVHGAPLVSIIIPTRDRLPLLERCIRSIETLTDYRRFEIGIVDNDSRERETLSYFESVAGTYRVCRVPGPFNFGQLINAGVAQARGDYLLFLNNDVEVMTPDWLTAMLEHAQRPEVGVVGAKLLYPDGRIQHAGVVVGIGGAAGHVFRFHPNEGGRDPHVPSLVRNCSAVTAACMMVRRRVFDEVGGFDERLRVVFNDIDFCLKARARGYLVVYTPVTWLYHYESASRGRLHPSEDERLFQERWADFIKRGDPYYSPNLTDAHDDASLRF